VSDDRLLRKRMGFWSLTAASLGGVIGSGWLFGAMFAARAAGPASIISWIVGGVALGLVALVFIELARVKPESGGLVRYPLYTNGSLVATMVGWGLWLGYVSNPPTEASGITQYMSRFWPGLYAGGRLTTAGLSVAVVLMILFVLVNYFGVHVFAKTNTVVTVIKFVVPGATLLTLLLGGFFQGQNLSGHGGFAPYGLSAALSAIATSGIIFAYTGFRAAVDLAGEAVNPKRDVPRAVVTALGVAIVLYIGLEIAFLGAVPGKILASGWKGVNFSSPFADLALSLNLMWLYWMLMADAMISPAGSSMVYTATNSRNVWALAKNRFFPGYFARINERFGVPTRALILNFVVGLLYLIPLKSWHDIIKITGVLGIYTYAAGAVSVLVFRQMGVTNANDGIKGMKVIAPLGFVVATLVIYWAKWSNLKATVPLLLLGLVLYLFSYYFNKYRLREITSGIWKVVYLLAVLLLSRLGSFGGINLIPAPWDSVVVAAVALAVYYWGVAAGVGYMKAEPGSLELLDAEAKLDV